MPENNELELKPINDLLELSFFIPAYQRGYHWTQRQVIELLNDIYEFSLNKNKSEQNFYCLQTVVVKERGEQWELVDGQQRLTTILLILGFFNSRFSENFRRQLYTIEYETRPECREYINNLDENEKDKNIDFHYIYEIYCQIRSWFKDKMNRVNDIEFVFLNDVKVIWYQINEHENATDVFTRLNMGEKPLQDLQQLKISQEWDAIEKSLQDDVF